MTDTPIDPPLTLAEAAAAPGRRRARGLSSFTQEDADRILKPAQKIEKAAQRTGVPIDRVMRAVITHRDGSKLEIEFRAPNVHVDENSNPWDAPPAGTGRLGR
jgi:hypothetical protein